MWREASPVGAIADLRTVYDQAGKNRWRFMALAALTTLGIFSMMSWESWKKPRPLPEITLINSWPEDRTAAETRAFVLENQRQKEAREAQDKMVRDAERDLYRQLGRASGMDVDAIEKKAAEDAARDAAAAEKARVDAVAKANASPANANPANAGN